MSDATYLTNNLRVRLEQDQDAEMPEDDLVQIAYLSKSRETLGTEAVSHERMQEIEAKIRSGEYVGVAVYAYVHSGATIRAAPFGDPWDGGQSGFAYATREQALAGWGGKVMTKKVRDGALAGVMGAVQEFDRWLTGDVYGFIVETREDEDSDWEEGESVWGFFGHEYALDEGLNEARSALDQEISDIANGAVLAEKEYHERTYWAERDVITGSYA